MHRRAPIPRGHTLLELLLTLAVAATVLAAGVASMGGLIARHRQSVELNALFHAVHLARKESIMRRQVVSLCPSADGASCLDGLDWSAGWILFENRNRDEPPRVDDGEPVLDRHVVDPALRITANRAGFTLRATVLRATNGTLVVCDRANRVPPKALVVSYTGRPRVAREDPRGGTYACAD
jgi:type IV fimbrial biogenesis protein FimT